MNKLISIITFIVLMNVISVSGFAADSYVEGETIPPKSENVEDNYVTLPAGTSIPIETSSMITSGNVVVGQRVNLRVSYAVKIGREIVIPAGSQVQGTVVSVKKRGIAGRPGKITIKAESVQAIDGTQIPLNSEPVSWKGKSKAGLAWGLTIGVFILLVWILIGFLSPLFLLIKGKDAIIPTGTSINATTYSNTEIEID